MTTNPAQIGKYRIIRLLGSGGMGRVYLGIDPDIGREVAIKVIQLDRAAGDGARERFLREARAMGRLNHPNIVTLLEYGVEADTPYLVLEFLQGEDLSEWLQRPHALVHYLRLMRDLAAAISAAHHAGVLHRDIKPDNIRVTADDRCKLLDFGIADGFDDSRLTGTGAFVGTTEFVAPEVISGQRHSEQSDIYALGLLYYQLLAGFNPFRADNVATTLARILQFTPAPLSAVRDGIPAALDELVEDCLEKDPARRPARADRLIEVLDQCLHGLDANAMLGPVKAAATVTATAFAAQTITGGSRRVVAERKRRRRWQAAMAILVLGGLFAAWWLLRTPAPVEPVSDQQAVAAAKISPPPSGTATATTQDSPPTVVAPDWVGAAAQEPAAAIDPADAVVAVPGPPRQLDPARPEAQRTAVIEPASRAPAKVAVPTSSVAARADAGGAAAAPRDEQRPSSAMIAAVELPAANPTNGGPERDRPAGMKPPLTRSLPATPRTAVPTITGSSNHFLVRGRPIRLVLVGEHFSGVTAARVLLGLKTDSRFQISDIEISDDGNLSLRIEAARNIPLGRYGLVLDSASGGSAPFLLEISL